MTVWSLPTDTIHIVVYDKESLAVFPRLLPVKSGFLGCYMDDKNSHVYILENGRTIVVTLKEKC